MTLGSMNESETILCLSIRLNQFRVDKGTYLEKPGTQKRSSLKVSGGLWFLATAARPGQRRRRCGHELSRAIIDGAPRRRDLEEWADKEKMALSSVSVNDTASLYVTMPDGGISSIHPVVIKGHHV
jgi:hypothetical protein